MRSRGVNQVKCVHIVLEDVNIAEILIGMSRGDDADLETLSLNYAKIGIESFSIVGGNQGERSEFAWNIPEDRVGSVTYPLDPTDSDSDGLPDAWETLRKVTDPLGDPDGDGGQQLGGVRGGHEPERSQPGFQIDVELFAGFAKRDSALVERAGENLQRSGDGRAWIAIQDVVHG